MVSVRLSQSADDLGVRYDAVVVGSGYGAGVAASRLARMGLSVAVLERGREIAPGAFPVTSAELRGELQVTSGAERRGRPEGLFHFHRGGTLNVLAGCGLGGTSLIDSGIAEPPDPRVFEDPCWPPELIEGGDLSEGFRRAAAMLRPQAVPSGLKVPRSERLHEAARRLGAHVRRPQLAIAFEAGRTCAGIEQAACTLCGDCSAGCNAGAKATVRSTYLADAAAHGAAIFTGVSVSHLERPGDTWHVLWRPAGEDGPLRSVAAAMVVLGAGGLGSTEILLRSAKHGLAIPQTLGRGLHGNGNAISVAYDGDKPANAVGIGEPPLIETDPPGPGTVGIIEVRPQRPLHESHRISDMALPSALADLLPGLMADAGERVGKETSSGVLDAFQEQVRRSQDNRLGAWRGAVAHTLAYIASGHGCARHTVALSGDGIEINRDETAREPVSDRAADLLLEAAAANSATHIADPLRVLAGGESAITFHPLGGCAMGRDRSRGVVDQKCRVFDGDPTQPGTAVHAGLYVVDAAIVPRSLGVPPLLTITALAERAMLLLARDLGRQLSVTSPAGGRPADSVPREVDADQGLVPRRRRFLRAGRPTIRELVTADGRSIRLTRYDKDGRSRKGPVLLVPGLGMSSRIFTLETLDTCLTEYLADRGFDCWLLDGTASPAVPAQAPALTADDCAQYDYAPAVAAILGETGASSLQVVAHCLGALTFSMAVLAGHVQGIRSAILSQAALDVVPAGLTQRLLAHLRLASLAGRMGRGRIAVRPGAAGDGENGLLDRLGVMTQGRRGMQSGAVAALFGALTEERQVDGLSMEAAAEATGEVSTQLIAHLGLMTRCKVLVDARGENVYMPRLDRMAFPIALLQGGRNACFDPSGTERSLAKLSARNGARHYERHVFPQYGHNDCLIGRDAVRDVYPAILAHLDRFQSV